MSRGRKPLGPKLVENVACSETAKQRLKVILQTITGEISVPQACAQLNIGEARFHELRTEWLTSAANALEPKPKGRPAETRSLEAAQIEELKAQNQQLKIELRAAQIREEIALVMPHLLKHGPQKEMTRQERLDAMQDALDEQEEEQALKKKPFRDDSIFTPKGSDKSGN